MVVQFTACVVVSGAARGKAVMLLSSSACVVLGMQERDATALELEELITQMEVLIQSKEAAEQQVTLQQPPSVLAATANAHLYLCLWRSNPGFPWVPLGSHRFLYGLGLFA